ncbi:MAG: AAA family ATPase [Bryobacteraceae bacterium]|nr:AAA family ATPase [Bryobacteraceae bacterium]
MPESRIYAIAQQKGGVGKTTTAINLGASLAANERRVLLVDLDPQGALTAGFGINPASLRRTIYDVLREPQCRLESILQPVSERLSLAPANIDLAAAEIELSSEPGRERILAEKLAPVLASFDVVLIDCPPSLGLLTLNALTTATDVLIPVQTEYFALRGMDLLMQTIQKVQARINPRLRITGILATMVDGRTIHSREVLEELKNTYGELLFDTAIPQTIKLADSQVAAQPILQFAPASAAAMAYQRLTEELFQR